MQICKPRELKSSGSKFTESHFLRIIHKMVIFFLFHLLCHMLNDQVMMVSFLYNNDIFFLSSFLLLFSRHTWFVLSRRVGVDMCRGVCGVCVRVRGICLTFLVFCKGGATVFQASPCVASPPSIVYFVLFLIDGNKVMMMFYMFNSV